MNAPLRSGRPARRSPRCRPGVEGLEERSLLSTLALAPEIGLVHAPVPAVVAPAPAAAPVSPGVIPRLYWPSDRQVTQRQDNGYGVVPVYGVLTGKATAIQFQATVNSGGNGVSTGWLPVSGLKLINGAFAGSVCLAQGGWYTLSFRAVADSLPGRPFSVAHVGVGEVFVFAGQSNAVNGGVLEPGLVVSDRISVFDHIATWTAGANPLPFTQGGGGNHWVYMANFLAAAWNVPIGLVPAALGATTIAMWQPGASPAPNASISAFDLLSTALKNLMPRGGARAVLFHQGESDRYTAHDVYQARLTSLILAARQAAGTNIPWVVALVSYIPGDQFLQPGESPIDPAIQPYSVRHAQYAVTRTVPLVYQGPTTDDMSLEYRDPASPIHMNVAGLRLHGWRWANVLINTRALNPKA